MATDFTIRAVNDWRAAITPTMERTLRVSMDVWRRSAADATKHMLILMAQSAAKMTPRSKKNRQVLRDEKNRQYVERMTQEGDTKKIYRFQCKRPDSRITWERAKSIGNRGLAQKSWLWGLGSKRKPIPGTSEVKQLQSGRLIGWQKTNRLVYIDKIMPANYQQAAEQKAMSRILKQAESRMVKQFEREVGLTA